LREDRACESDKEMGGEKRPTFPGLRIFKCDCLIPRFIRLTGAFKCRHEMRIKRRYSALNALRERAGYCIRIRRKAGKKENRKGSIYSRL